MKCRECEFCHKSWETLGLKQYVCVAGAEAFILQENEVDNVSRKCPLFQFKVIGDDKDE